MANINDCGNGGGIKFARIGATATSDAVVTGACRIHWAYVFMQGNGELDLYDALTAGNSNEGDITWGASGNDTATIDLMNHPVKFSTGLSLRTTTGSAGSMAVVAYSVD